MHPPNNLMLLYWVLVLVITFKVERQKNPSLEASSEKVLEEELVDAESLEIDGENISPAPTVSK